MGRARAALARCSGRAGPPRVVYTLTLMIGAAGLPHVIIRFFTVPKVSDARLSAGWALVFIAILYTTAPAVAAMARLNLTETIQTIQTMLAT